MELSFSYEQKIILIREKNKNNIKKVCNIFSSSLEKYKKYLSFIIQEDRKNKNEEKVRNPNGISSKKKEINKTNIFVSENINKIKIKYMINNNGNKNEKENEEENEDENENEDEDENEDKNKDENESDEKEKVFDNKNNGKKNENNYKIKIFGESFVDNNKDKCYIIYNRIKYNLKSYFYITIIKLKN